MRFLRILTPFVALRSLTAAFAQSDVALDNCKCIPHEPCWPSEAAFQALNQSVDGSLVRGVPPGCVCYPDQHNYDKEKCRYVRDNWLVSTFHALDPVSIGWPQWAGNPCPPIYPNGTSVNGDTKAGEKGCKLGGYPAYALNATDATHVQKVVQFVAKHKIRLNVKSTGHSFTGRSTAYGSISIWTHYLQGVRYHDNFRAESCTKSHTETAFRIAAGSRVRDVYQAANEQNMIVVAGSAEDVGVVGWMSGGGHGPLSSTYGMGVDNLLQATVVTPQGDLVTANECSHPDLFWALRGGGGGTFGVITEVVMKAYPGPTIQSMSFSLTVNTGDSLDPFWNAVVHFWSELPRLKDRGVSGYSYIHPPRSSPTGKWSMAGVHTLFNHQNGSLETLFEPFKENFGSFSDSVNWTTTPAYHSSFFGAWNSSVGYESVGGSGGILGSRLLPAHTLTSDTDHLRKALQNITAGPGSGSFGLPLHFFMVANSENRHLNVSLNPDWRDAILHVVALGGFRDNATLVEQRAAYDRMTYGTVPQLKRLAPDSGAYLNEGDPNDPDWQQTFFGANYERLRAVKERYDPDSVLWCRSCVGSESWMPQNRYGDENGEGKLCRVKSALKKQENQYIMELWRNLQDVIWQES